MQLGKRLDLALLLFHKHFMASAQKIQEIKNAFHNEWLLIVVDSFDESRTEPLTGTLIDHGLSPEPLLEEAAKLGKETLVIYSEDWPDDLAACF